MTIHDWQAYKKGIWDWGILDGCFGDTRIKPTDLDGFTERKGKFLILEAKAPDEPLVETDGQMISFRALQKTGLFTVMILWGPNSLPQKMKVLAPKWTSIVVEVDLAQVRCAVNMWFLYADRNYPYICNPRDME